MKHNNEYMKDMKAQSSIQVDHEEGQKWKTIILTIDSEIQKFTYELLKGRAGSISVMDIYTGEIIAMNSSPSFDPNLFLYGINPKKCESRNKLNLYMQVGVIYLSGIVADPSYEFLLGEYQVRIYVLSQEFLPLFVILHYLKYLLVLVFHTIYIVYVLYII